MCDANFEYGPISVRCSCQRPTQIIHVLEMYNGSEYEIEYDIRIYRPRKPREVCAIQISLNVLCDHYNSLHQLSKTYNPAAPRKFTRPPIAQA